MIDVKKVIACLSGNHSQINHVPLNNISRFLASLPSSPVGSSLAISKYEHGGRGVKMRETCKTLGNPFTSHGG